MTILKCYANVVGVSLTIIYDTVPRTKLKTYEFDYERALNIVKLLIYFRSTEKFNRKLDLILTFTADEINEL